MTTKKEANSTLPAHSGDGELGSEPVVDSRKLQYFSGVKDGSTRSERTSFDSEYERGYRAGSLLAQRAKLHG